MKHMKYGWVTLATMVISAVFLSNMATASTKDSWAKFRANVEKACLSIADDSFNVESIAVDPFGSQHFGLARLTGHEQGVAQRSQLLCVYDKETHQAEIGGPMEIKTDMQADQPQEAAESTDPEVTQ